MIWAVIYLGETQKIFENEAAAKLYVYDRLYNAYHQDESAVFNHYHISPMRIYTMLEAKDGIKEN